MRYLLAFLLLVPGLRAFGAAGDWLGFQVETNGWQLLAYMSGGATNGTYTFGWPTNQFIDGNQRLIVTLSREGYDSTGAAITRKKTIYGGARVRKPYPDNAAADEVYDSGSGILRLRLSLTDEIYSNDTVIAVTTLQGLYKQGSVTSAVASAVSATNGSTITYPKIISNWAKRGWQIIDDPAMELRVVAFHMSADERQPVAAVQIRATDGTSSYTNLVSAMTKVVHPLWADMPVVQLYSASFPTSYFGASKRVLCNYTVYPREGNSNTVFDTATGGYVEPTVYPCPLTNFVNWPRVRAVVSGTGVNASGVAADETYWSTNTAPAEFLNIGAAANAIQGTNIATYGITNCTGGIILLKDWTTYLGSSVSANLMDGELLITRHSSKAWDEVGITNYSTDRVISTWDILRFKEITLDSTAALMFTIDQRGQTWDRCRIINGGGSKLFGAATLYRMTDCLVSNLYNGFRASGTDGCTWDLVAGNRIVGNCGSLIFYTALGNYKTVTNNMAVSDAFSAMGQPRSAPGILAYNRFPGQNITYFDVGAQFPCTWGQAIVQNEAFEFIGTSPATYGASLWQSSLIHATNVLVWNNTFLGAKVNSFYDNLSTTATWRVQCQMLNNVASTKPIKSDTFTSDHPDGNRVGNWSEMWGVNFSGNAWLMTTNLSDFSDEEFFGTYTYVGYNAPTNWAKWVDEKAFNGVTNFGWAGFGNYRWQGVSPVKENTRSIRVPLPYDLEGNARSQLDPPGPYNSATRRKAAGMFN